MKNSAALALLFSVVSTHSIFAASATQKSVPLNQILREPLPPEVLQLTTNRAYFTITGPTFTYRVQRSSGVISGIQVNSDGAEVIAERSAANILLDDLPLLPKNNSARVTVVSSGTDKIVMQSDGVFATTNQNAAEIDFTVLHTFFNDGVVVSSVTLKPRVDFPVHQAIAYQLSARGEFNNYLHKRRDEHGQQAARGRLPEAGGAIRFTNLTSCLSVVSPTAAMAIFTDGGAIYPNHPKLATAGAEVTAQNGNRRDVALTQYIVRLEPGEQPFVIKAGEPFTFRTGISVAPNRLPHRRTQDLRMFIWIGDKNFPYPTDDEITQVAQTGYTIFQLHRVGTPGEPRPPAGELERVIRKVHELGMLFVWEENADLIYASASGVQELQRKGEWKRWQGFNYDGRYTATMDPYCDLIATCLASPNGLAEYRLANITRMLERYDVDGIYLDDNLGYSNCTLWKEHGHPREVYDCLIELHEMNWRRRELMRAKVPHLVLISHNTRAFVLPVIADFDVQYFAEGYCFNSAQDYWENYRAWGLAMNSQSMICPGDDEGVRCNAPLICNYDMLTGGGQYNQMDWRLFPQKFHYAGGVTPRERVYSQFYNLAQLYFGMSEATPFYFANSTNLFATTAAQTHATIYRNEVWNDWLIALANMNSKPEITSLNLRSTRELGIQSRKNYLLFDVHERKVHELRGADLNQTFAKIPLAAQSMKLFALREIQKGAPFHVWGGKRIAEKWNARTRQLELQLQAPAGLKETIFIQGGEYGIANVTVNGESKGFFFDSVQNLAHGEIHFGTQPITLRVECANSSKTSLPESSPAPIVLDQ